MFSVSDVKSLLTDVYPLPLYMTYNETCMKFYMLSDDGETVMTVGMCVHNRDDDTWDVRIRRRRREFLIQATGSTRKELYQYFIREAKLLASVMEEDPDKYLSRRKKNVREYEDGRVYTKYVEVNGEKSRRNVMNQDGSVFILADEQPSDE